MKNGEKSFRTDGIGLGVCYYPEHWPESLWENDLDRMLEHGIETVRIAEFAWNKFEPSDGTFVFEFFDRFLELAERKKMDVIFCTPTATPPAWLTHAHPEVLNAGIDGTLLRHGLRRHYTYNSPAYGTYSARITERLAEHYCPHPAVIGWQIDNELNCETDVFYSEADHDAFREYLKKKFGTLDILNDAMGTVFWNQTYTSWDELHLSRPTLHMTGNPHLKLEEKRFFSESAVSFCRLQSDILKKYRRKDQFITTNGLFGHLDSHRMTDEALDFISYDSYPDFAFGVGTGPCLPEAMNDRRWSFNLARVRSISPNFCVMEQQTGAGGWNARMMQPAPRPGRMRLWTFQSIAHGADFVGYFRWRTSPVGNEIYWHGLNDYSNLPNRRLAELKRIRDDVEKIRHLAGSTCRAGIALVKDYDNEWDGENDEWYGPLARFSENGWFAASQTVHAPMDVLFVGNGSGARTSLEDLKNYRLLVYPHPAILTGETAGLLAGYVAGGGTLIMGARTGYKDRYGRCPMKPMPGPASELCGVRVIDYTLLGPEDGQEFADWGGERIDAPIFNDILEPIGPETGERTDSRERPAAGSRQPTSQARIEAVFRGNWYDGAPALVRNAYGDGTAWYFGAGFSAPTAETFLRKLGFAEPYRELLELPAGVELSIRRKGGTEYAFLLNYRSESVGCTVKKPLTDLLTGKTVSGTVRLEPFGVSVLENTGS